jgi:hypothetical protein
MGVVLDFLEQHHPELLETVAMTEKLAEMAEFQMAQEQQPRWTDKRMKRHFKLVRQRNKKLLAEGKPIPISKTERTPLRRERRAKAKIDLKRIQKSN